MGSAASPHCAIAPNFTPRPPSADVSTTPTSTTSTTQPSLEASSSASPTSTDLPSYTGKKPSKAGAIGGAVAGSLIAILLGILGLFVWRRQKKHHHRDHTPVELDGSVHGEHDIDPEPYIQSLHPTFSSASTPTAEFTSTSRLVRTSSITPSAPADPSSTEGGHKKPLEGYNPEPAQPLLRAPLSPAELIQGLMERNVPQPELASAIRMLAESHGAGGSNSNPSTYSGEEPPPMYDFKGAGARE